MTDPAEVTILLVEDDPGHARLIERNLRRNEVTNTIVQLADGQSAVDYLFSDGDYSGQRRPDRLMMLLDLNLPGLDGYQVLRRVKHDPSTQNIPVVVLTTTEDAREVNRCYELGCSMFVTKPVNYDEFTETLRRLGQLLSIVKVPQGN
ncbi:MAG: response regulator [Acidobacteriota bacterium]